MPRSVTSSAADSSGGSTDTVKAPIIPPPPPPKEPRRPLAQRLQAALGTDAKEKAAKPEKPARSKPTPQPSPQVERRPVSPMPVAPPAPSNGSAPAASPVTPPAAGDTAISAPVRPAKASRRAPVPPARPAARPVTQPVGTTAGRKPRRARLRLTRIDPWSVMKTAFLLSIALGIVTVVSVFMVWSILGAAGVWDSINATVASVLGGEDGSGFNVQDYVGVSRIMGFTILISIIDVILLTAIATLAAFLYNLAAALLGGIEVTLAED
ncbi:MAG: DUF3566 domain-containing protein [Nocardioides sp.]